MARDQFAIFGHHARHGPAELGHAGGDLRHLVVAVHLGIVGIGAQPSNRPGFNLARREDEVHAVAFGAGQGGQSDARDQIGQRRDQSP